MDQNSPSLTIINKDNNSLTGENAQALPIKLVTSATPLKYIASGIITTVILFTILVYMSKVQVLSVETTGIDSGYQEFKIK